MNEQDRKRWKLWGKIRGPKPTVNGQKRKSTDTKAEEKCSSPLPHPFDPFGNFNFFFLLLFLVNNQKKYLRTKALTNDPI